MRPYAFVVLACLAASSMALSACGSSRKTVIVNPPPGSTTVVDSDGHAHVIENRDDYR
ncbi:MAG: hypothetical protein H6924_12790 [Alphaproteobacteria bacterium]|nr:hypothetical protein [Alphaproteobacteria bacterium]